MQYEIHHTTRYLYSAPVELQPHVLRLRPRSDSWQTLHDFRWTIEPASWGYDLPIDLDGNTLLKAWFTEQSTEQLVVQVTSRVETHCTNPFQYLLEPWATRLPFDYPESLVHRLSPYLHAALPGRRSLDQVVIDLAQEIQQETDGQVQAFLSELNLRIYHNCRQVLRPWGDPLPPAMTWKRGEASCRDVTVLFMEVCRAAGLAARFVSGYHETDPGEAAHLHAWAEVYLPGAGWRGYDPTQGLAVADRHVALVATPSAMGAAPISGSFRGQARSSISYELRVNRLGEKLP